MGKGERGEAEEGENERIEVMGENKRRNNLQGPNNDHYMVVTCRYEVFRSSPIAACRCAHKRESQPQSLFPMGKPWVRTLKCAFGYPNTLSGICALILRHRK